MEITILEQIYRTGCEKGITELKRDGVLEKLNTVINWDSCVWPLKKVGEEFKEDKNFLGDTPSLKPGNCFLYDGQVIAVDGPDRLILILSETGYGGLQRFYTETLLPEYEIIVDRKDSIYELNFEELEWVPGSEELETYHVPYAVMKAFKSRYGFTRPVKVECESPLVFSKALFYITNWKVMYNKHDIDPDIIDELVLDVFSWFYYNHKKE